MKFMSNPRTGSPYHTMGEDWGWDAEGGTLTVEDYPAATCAICHNERLRHPPTTHDLGDRLTWYLFAPISTRRPNWEDNKAAMQGVCYELPQRNFINTFYTDADKATERVNEWVEESREIIAPLQENDLLTDAPFDEPIDYVFFDLWRHTGPDHQVRHPGCRDRTTPSGTGAYEVLRELAELQEMVEVKLHQAGEVGTLDERRSAAPSVWSGKS